MIIKRYEDKYKDGVRKVCIETSSIKCSDEALLLLYCDYYIEEEKDNCFVAVDSEDNVIGYILSSINYKSFIKTYKSKYLKKLKSVDKFMAKGFKGEAIMSRVMGKDYPAHLHIDILPNWQRMGIGRMLIEELLNHLKNISVNGIYLSCGTTNENAKNFYKKIGFNVYLENPYVCVYTKLIR